MSTSNIYNIIMPQSRSLYNQLVTSVDATESSKRTFLGVPLAHTLTAAAATLDSSENAIQVWSTAPFLMGQHIHAQFLLSGLNHADIGEHAFILERAREFRRDGCVGVQTGEGDQLQNKSMLVSFCRLCVQ